MRSLLVIFSVLMATKTFAAGFDGCYHMYKPMVSYPVFCLEGTTEEGIGGSNARLSLFHVNTDQPTHCFRTSGLAETANPESLAVEINGIKELEMTVTTRTSSGLRQGSVTLGHTTLQFIERDEKATERFLKNLSESGLCQ